MGALGDYIWDRHLPGWAKLGHGGKLMSTLCVVADVCADMMLRASQAGLISSPLSPDDVLGLVGKERGGLFKYPAESFSQFRARLLRAVETWDSAGGDYAILSQLEAAGFPGCSIELFPDRTGPRGQPAPYRSQFWVRFPQELGLVTTTGPQWNDFEWNDGTLWGPGNLSRENYDTIVGIINKFKDAQHVCAGLLFVVGDARWNEFNWNDGTLWAAQIEIGVP